MKKLFKTLAAAALTALMTAFCVIPAFAAVSVSTGDTVVVSVSVENEDAMGSTTIQIDYDSNLFDFLSDEETTSLATSAVNDQTPGQILWVAIFGADGKDFTEKTEVYRCLLVAKQDIADIDGLISFTVKDAYRIGGEGIEKADPAKLTCLIFPEGREPQEENESQQNAQSSQTTSENVDSDRTTVPSKPDVTSSNSNSSKAAFGSSSSSNTSSASSKAKDSDKTATSSSGKSTDKDTDKVSSKKDTDTSNTDTEEKAEELSQGFTEKDFESVPAIKTETADTASEKPSSKGKFPAAAIVGIVVALAAAAVGIVALKVNKEK